MSEPLFRLLLIRSPVDPNPGAPPISLSQDTPFQKDLANAAKSTTPADSLGTVARAFIAGKSFIGQPDASPFQVKLLALGMSLDTLQQPGTLFLQDIVDAVKKAFGKDVGKVVTGDDFQALLKGLIDSVVAIKFVPEEHDRPIEALVKQIRDLELMQKAASLTAPALTSSGSSTVSTETQTHGPDLLPYRNRSLQIPVEVDLKSIISPPPPGEGDNDPRDVAAKRERLASSLITRHENLLKAINELVSLGPNNLRAPVANPHPGVVVDKQTPYKLFVDQLDFQTTLRDINVAQFKAAADRGGTGQPDPLKLQDLGGANSALALSRDLLTVPRGVTPLGPWKPQVPSEFTMVIDKSVVLSDTTQAILKDKNIDVQVTPVNEIVRLLREDDSNTLTSLARLAPNLEKVSIQRVSGGFVKIRTPIPSKSASILLGHNFGLIDHALPILADLGRIPATKGKATISGVADLLVVRQQLKGYEGADVADIENVLKGESKSREHTSTTKTETTTLTETEVTTTDDNELASTSRFEMSQESAATIKEDQSLKAGLQVSASYGPFVQVSASIEGATSRSKEEATKSATKFSQGVTERTIKKITQRILQRQTTTVTKEIVEKDSHGINNAPGTVNISGVYQWVNKLYEAQIFNYGLRTMFDFMVPEPATFLLEVDGQSAENQVNMLEKPIAFTQTPADITPNNYAALVLRYEATDVVPPPEDYDFKTDQVSKGGGNSQTDWDYGAVITIEKGYQAIYATVSKVANIWEHDAVADVYVGTRTHRFADKDGEWSWGAPLNNEIGSISWGFITFHMANIVLSVEIKCIVTQHAIDLWKADTHAKLLNAYKAQLQNYEDKLAALKLQSGPTIQGTNPTANLITIKEELKKNCISILTAQHYDMFNSLSISASTGLPEINFDEAEAEGRYVRFFEQAFEWEQIMYVAYPYFWGQKEQWRTRIAFDDPDPVFTEFVKAGFCRVMVPARPGFEGAIDHFLQFGQLWNGGPLPAISSKLFLPIADEIAENAQRPGSEVPQGDPWTVRLPTTLVKLRKDDQLPKWKKDQNGDWVPDNFTSSLGAPNQEKDLNCDGLWTPVD